MPSSKAIDYTHRDPNSMNTYIQVEFDDVLAEPTGAHSAQCVWKNAYKCFNCGFNCCYKFMTFLCGICIGELIFVFIKSYITFKNIELYLNETKRIVLGM
jgi:hypothetical protein